MGRRIYGGGGRTAWLPILALGTFGGHMMFAATRATAIARPRTPVETIQRLATS